MGSQTNVWIAIAKGPKSERYKLFFKLFYRSKIEKANFLKRFLVMMERFLVMFSTSPQPNCS